MEWGWVVVAGPPAEVAWARAVLGWPWALPVGWIVPAEAGMAIAGWAVECFYHRGTVTEGEAAVAGVGAVG